LIKNRKSTPNLTKADEIEKSSGAKNLSRKGKNLENAKKKDFTARSPLIWHKVARGTASGP
jgi:hypothetical protein